MLNCRNFSLYKILDLQWPTWQAVPTFARCSPPPHRQPQKHRRLQPAQGWDQKYETLRLWHPNTPSQKWKYIYSYLFYSFWVSWCFIYESGVCLLSKQAPACCEEGSRKMAYYIAFQCVCIGCITFKHHNGPSELLSMYKALGLDTIVVFPS